MSNRPVPRLRLRAATAIAATAVVMVLPLHAPGFGALTLGATAAQATCTPDVSPNCPPPPPPPPPPCDPACPPPPPPVTCVPDVGPVHAWPCPVDATEQCAEAAGGYTTCPAAHVGVSSEQVGPVTTPAYDTGTINIPVPNASWAWRTAYHATVECAWEINQCRQGGTSSPDDPPAK